MKLLRKVGATSEIWQIFVADSSSTTGAGLAGLTNASSGLTAYYHRDTDTTATAISLVTMTVGTFTSSGFKEIDATNMPGWYQFCPPNAALASGAKSCAFHLKGATNMAPLPIEVDLDGQVDVTFWNGTVVATPATAGIPDVNVKNVNNVSASSVTTVNANVGQTQPVNFTGTGASALVKSDAVDVAGTAVAAASAGYFPADVRQLLGTAWLTPGTAGTPDVNVKLWNGLTTVALPLVPTTAGRTLDVSATGEAGVDWANVGGQSTSVNLSATTVNLVNTATTVTNQLTAAQVATGVWQDATAGDFTTASSIGKSLYTAGVVPGGAGGLLISGSNSGTTTLGALTVTGATTLAAVSGTTLTLSGAVAFQSTFTITGAFTASAGFVNTYPVGAYYPSNVVDSGTAQSVTSTTLVLRSAAAFADSELVGATVVIRSATTGAGQRRVITANVGSTDTVTVDAWTTTPTGTIVYDVFGTAPGSTAVPTAVNVTQWLGTAVSTPTVAGVPNVNAKTWNDLATVALPLTPTTAGRTLDVSAGGEAGIDWANVGTPGATVNLSATTVNLTNTLTTYTGNTVQTGDSFARIGAAGVGLTAVALADATSDAVIADAVWNALTASYGSAGTYGLLIETDLDATVSSRMASYTQPSGFLTATFPSGTLTNNTTTPSWYTGPSTPPTTAQIATAVWTDLLAGSDFSTAASIGKLLKDDIDAAVSSRMATFALPTNFSALGITAAGKISEVVLTDTLTTYTGNTPQTGDAYARIGANGAGLTVLSTDAQLVKVLAAVYDSNVGTGGDTLTLSNGAVQTFDLTTGSRTTT